MPFFFLAKSAATEEPPRRVSSDRNHNLRHPAFFQVFVAVLKKER
jgi:hypothetical protein